MKYEELLKLFEYSEKESKLFMPNEIFIDLKNNINKGPHIAFAYTYIYLCTWLYRYAKHFNVNVFDNKIIKETLGYSARNQSLDYLIKKDGLLDQIEYTASTKEFPMSWKFCNIEKTLEFEMSTDYKDFKEYLPSISKRFFLKYPNKAFYRIGVEEGEEYEYAGTFHEIKNTHNMPFEVFLYCMSNEEVGCNGFYLYSFLRHKNDIFTGGYDISLNELSNETGLPRRTLSRYMDALKGYRMIDFRHNQEYFVTNMNKEERKANTYIIRDHDFFECVKKPYGKMNIMSEENYIKLKQERESYAKDIENDLPF